MGIMTILKKELRRVFGDKKMIFGMFIMPPLMMIIIFSLIGNTMGDMMEDVESHKSLVYFSNLDEKTEADLGSIAETMIIESVKDDEMESLKEKLKNGEIDAIVELPSDFRDKIENYDRENIPNINIFYNPSEDNSEVAYRKLESIFDENIKKPTIKNRIKDEKILEVYTINKDTDATIFKEEKMSGKALSMMLPYFIVIMLYSSIMGLAIDTFTGEKERGTMASLLLAPIKRTDIVLGKLIGLTIISMISSIAYVVSMSIVMPKAMSFGQDTAVKFTFAQFGQIALIMLSMAFLMVAMISIIATYSKNAKEAGTYIAPLYIVVIVAGVMTMTSTGEVSPIQYLIPIYGSCIAIGRSIIAELTVTNLLYSIGSNILIGLIFSFIVAKMFSSEKIMFNS
ncbi:ABC transporter permease [Peptoniphilus sp.]|uniref:ABC transporter permease n=1 Tax=Peptoniphilus sp. TaxID=1971214 RepID=UPI0039920166